MPLSRRETSLMRCKKIICLGEKKYDEAKGARVVHAHTWHSNTKNKHARDAESSSRLAMQTRLAHVNVCMRHAHTPAMQMCQTEEDVRGKPPSCINIKHTVRFKSTVIIEQHNMAVKVDTRGAGRRRGGQEEGCWGANGCRKLEITWRSCR